MHDPDGDEEDDFLHLDAELAGQINAMQEAGPFDNMTEATQQLLAWERKGYNIFILSTEAPKLNPPAVEKPVEDSEPTSDSICFPHQGDLPTEPSTWRLIAFVTSQNIRVSSAEMSTPSVYSLCGWM